VIGSVLCLAALFTLVFRRSIRLFAMTFTPVAVGVLYGFGVYALFSRNVTPLTGVIGAVLAGIGIDYSVFYLVHYLERRAAGALPVDAARHTISAIGGALLAAWVTSVVGFVAIVFASVRALRDFSIVGSLGLAGALLGAVFILPALLVLMDRFLFRRSRLRAVSAGSISGTLLASEQAKRVLPALRISIGPLLSWIDRHAALCVSIAIGLLAFAMVSLVTAGPWLAMEPDPTVLHPRPNPPLDAQARIAERMGSAPDSLIVHLCADSPEQLLALAHRVNEKLTSQPAKDAGVSSTFGLASLLPDPTAAPRRLEQIGPALADRVLADFDAVVADSSFEPKAYAPYRGFLRTLLTPTAAPGIREMLPYTQLAETFLPRQAFAGSTPTEAIALVFLNQAMDQRATRIANITALRSLLHGIPGATLTGMAVLSLDTEATIQRDLPRLILAAVVIIALYLLLHFRSVTDALLAVLPTLFSLTCLLAIAKLTGAKMNLANIVSVPLLIGIDVDYGIFLVSVARQTHSRAELLDRAAASSLAVVLCAAATLLGFGSLAFTSVPAIRSLGWAVGIGVVTCAAASLFLLLPLLLWMKNRPAFKVARLGKVVSQVALIVVALWLCGCSPPSGRLTFPTAPIAKTADREWFDVHHTGRHEFGLAYDSAGRVDRLLYDEKPDGTADREYRLSDYANERVPHLILLLDSLPFETVLERYNAGDFRWFSEPQKMIAPFPSLTEICYSDVLHAPPLPGVTDRYFDPRDQERKGVLWARVRGFTQPWERRLHYHANYMQQGLSFLHPDRWYAAELEQARRAVEKSPDRVTIVYIASAASMVCKYGKPGAEAVLDGARQLCLQLMYERRGAIKISIMADHGHNYTPSKNVLLAKLLTDAGFHPADRIAGDQDCVVEVNALVTCASLTTRQPAAVSAALCNNEAVELAIYSEGPRVILRTKQGTSAVECRDGQLRYIPLDADVLGYGPLIAQLKAEGQMNADGFAGDEVWFRRTLDHPWPNAPRRVWDALHGRFINPPTVMLSIKDGFYAGDPTFEKYIKMASTHGGLNQVNSATFVITMTGRLNKAVRHEDVIGTIEPGFEPRVQR
jgi:predicted RND superfamily exporter protein